MDKEEAMKIMEDEAERLEVDLEDVILDFNRIEIKTNEEVVEEMKEEGVLDENYVSSYEGYAIQYDYEDSENNIATQGETVEEAYRMLVEAVALHKGLTDFDYEELMSFEEDL